MFIRTSVLGVRRYNVKFIIEVEDAGSEPRVLINARNFQDASHVFSALVDLGHKPILHTLSIDDPIEPLKSA